MKLHYLLALSLLLMEHAEFAYTDSGSLFDATATGGATGHLSGELCLNGIGPVSCQKYYFDHFNLSILSTIANHTYSSAGIKLDRPVI